jgi:mRNA-degrading endonuclease RelE of RelBE toxin-antitoxin system
MSYSIETIPPFDRQFKRLLKKYPSLKKDVLGLSETLLDNPTTGDNLGNNCYKVRMAVGSKNKGKSGGARVITHIHIAEEIIYLLSIYDKSEQETITDEELEHYLSFIDIQ